MTRAEFKAYRRSIRDNGRAYTIRHARPAHRATLQALYPERARVNWLACRAKWLANPAGDDRAVIVKLSSFLTPVL
jgi:hypothetical protein